MVDAVCGAPMLEPFARLRHLPEGLDGCQAGPPHADGGGKRVPIEIPEQRGVIQTEQLCGDFGYVRGRSRRGGRV